MRYLRKFNESVKGFFASMSDAELKEWIEDLTIELDDIQEKIGTIRSILRDRKDNKDLEFAKGLPDSIYDFSKEQLDWVFEHNHSTGKEKYNISKKYISELGIFDNGFNPNTNQFKFNISTSSFFNELEDEYERNENKIKAIEFLGENLKKENNEYVLFDVMYYFKDTYGDKVRFYSKDKVDLYNSRFLIRSFNSVDELLEYIVDDDIGMS
jgi:hypothetical protein